MGKGSSSQSSSQASDTAVSDSRVGVADQGVYAGAGAAVSQGNDLRTFDDHSSFALTTKTDTTSTNTNTDSRSFDDHSSFSSVTQDNRSNANTEINTDSRSFDDHSSFSSVSKDSRDFSSNYDDHSAFNYSDSSQRTTNITSSDPELVRAATEQSAKVATAGLSSAVSLSQQSTKLFESAIGFGESVTGQAFKASNAVTEAGFGAVGDSNARSLDFAAQTQAGAGSLVDKALTLVSKSADADRAFASEFTGRIFDTTKSADQANVEKLVKAATLIVGVIAVVWGAAKIFGKAKS